VGVGGEDYPKRVVECAWGQLSDMAFRLWDQPPPRLTVEMEVVLWEPEPEAYLAHLVCRRIELVGRDSGLVQLTAYYGERDGA
jgi:hypothetical protein